MANYRRYRKSATGKKRRAPKIPQSDLQVAWEQRILEAEQKKDEWKEEFHVKELEQIYAGNQRPDTWEEDDWFTINLVFATARILKRNVCPRHLEAKLRLSRSFTGDIKTIYQMQQIVKLRQAVLQYFITQLKLWKEGQMAYLNSLWQFGVVKVGYSADMYDNPNAGGVLFDREGNVIYDSEGKVQYQPEYAVESEEFFIDQVDPDCFLVDRYCQNDVDKTGRWVAQKFFTSVSDMERDTRYSRKALQNLDGAILLPEEIEELGTDRRYRFHMNLDSSMELPENDIIVGYEIYDLENEETLTLVRGAKDLVIKPKPIPEGVPLHPFVILKFNERKGQFYPIPAIYNWVGPQAEYNLARNQMATHRRRFNRKYGYIDGWIDEEELEKLESGKDGTGIKFNQPGAVEPIKDAPLDPQATVDTTILRREFMELTGVGDQQRNITGADSATEAEIVERRAREGEVDEHEDCMDFISEIIKKLHFCMEANLTQEGAIELVGPGGTEWITFGPEHFQMIQGEVIFTASAEETTRMTLQVERAQLLQLLEILGRNPLLTLDENLLRAVIDKFDSLKNNEVLIQSMKQLGQVQLQLTMMENQQKQQKERGSTNSGSPQKVKKETSTGKEASKSRKVATK